MKKFFINYARSFINKSNAESGALLVVRLIAGTAMIIHGWSKIQNPGAWMGDDAGVPSLFQSLAALAEFGGGIAWVLGLFVPLASFGILCTMGVAVYTHISHGDMFISHGQSSYELAAAYFSVAVLFQFAGPGKCAIDYFLTKDKQ